MSLLTLVIPCYNEAMRLPHAAFAACIHQQRHWRFVFVDDGSSDQTLKQLNTLQQLAPDRVEVLALLANQGKGEAVRRGLQAALKHPSEVYGFIDADLATPLDEVARLVAVLQHGEAEVLLAARVALLGRRIDRNRWRHYFGRCFATGVSWVLQLPIYDSQCGAKFFSSPTHLQQVLKQPFTSRWIFDVELLWRYLHLPHYQPGMIYEEPLQCWRDVAGSKVTVFAMMRASWELLRIWSLRFR